MQLIQPKMLRPHSGSRLRLRRSGLRRVVLTVALASLTLSGCATTTTYLTEEDSVVSESLAKRDLGMDYLSSFRTGMAIRQLEASLELDATDPQTHLWLGEAYRRKGYTEKAEVFLKDAIKLAVEKKERSSEQQARLNLSAMLSQMGRYEESLPHCEKLTLDATFSSPWLPLTNWAWALIQLGREDEARQKLGDALDFFPNYSPALLNLGILEAKQGHRVAAISAFEEALEAGRLHRAGRAEANFRLGEIYVALGHRENAVKHFSESVENAPNVDWGTQSQAYLDLIQR